MVIKGARGQFSNLYGRKNKEDGQHNAWCQVHKSKRLQTSTRSPANERHSLALVLQVNDDANEGTFPTKNEVTPPEQQQAQVQGYVIPVVSVEPHVSAASPAAPVYYINEDPACNMYWVLFFLGFLIGFPAFWACGALGMRSSRHNEKIAGKANLIALGVILLFAVIYAVVASLSDSNNLEDN